MIASDIHNYVHKIGGSEVSWAPYAICYTKRKTGIFFHCGRKRRNERVVRSSGMFGSGRFPMACIFSYIRNRIHTQFIVPLFELKKATKRSLLRSCLHVFAMDGFETFHMCRWPRNASFREQTRWKESEQKRNCASERV